VKNTKRLCPSRALPPYRFIPGKTPHPEKKGGYLNGKNLDFSPLENEDFFANPDFCYAVDLFNHQYFWEAHIYWEGLWHQVGRKGERADFLKALIKLTAGKLKVELNQEEAAYTHWLRAKELLSPLAENNRFSPFSSLLLDIIAQLDNSPIQSVSIFS
jgi:predicted metal-dependent hydrolase